jgi:hypothetical protein
MRATGVRYFFAPVCVGIEKFYDTNLDPRLLAKETRSYIRFCIILLHCTIFDAHMGLRFSGSALSSATTVPAHLPLLACQHVANPEYVAMQAQGEAGRKT